MPRRLSGASKVYATYRKTEERLNTQDGLKETQNDDDMYA